MSLFDLFQSLATDNANAELWQFMHWQVRVIRSQRRRTLSLELKPHQPITVRANKRTSKREIERVLTKKLSWLEKNLAHLNQLPRVQSLGLKQGEQIFFLGRGLSLQRSITTLKSCFLIVEGQGAKLLLPLSKHQDNLDPQEVRLILRQFYLREAKKYLPQRIQEISQRVGLFPKKLRIGYMNSRWGSCSSQGNISINSKIMAAPDWVIESVIVHELCHLKHMNHSREYWKLANQHFSKHAEADQWLHDHLS